MNAYRNDSYRNKLSSWHHVNTQMQRTVPNISLISSAVIFSSYINIFVVFHPPPFVRLYRSGLKSRNIQSWSSNNKRVPKNFVCCFLKRSLKKKELVWQNIMSIAKYTKLHQWNSIERCVTRLKPTLRDLLQRGHCSIQIRARGKDKEKTFPWDAPPEVHSPWKRLLQTGERYALRIVLVITILYKTHQWRKWKKWLHKMNLADSSATSPHTFYRKHIETTNKNSNFD